MTAFLFNIVSLLHYILISIKLLFSETLNELSHKIKYNYKEINFYMAHKLVLEGIKTTVLRNSSITGIST